MASKVKYSDTSKLLARRRKIDYRKILEGGGDLKGKVKQSSSTSQNILKTINAETTGLDSTMINSDTPILFDPKSKGYPSYNDIREKAFNYYKNGDYIPTTGFDDQGRKMNDGIVIKGEYVMLKDKLGRGWDMSSSDYDKYYGINAGKPFASYKGKAPQLAKGGWLNELAPAVLGVAGTVIGGTGGGMIGTTLGETLGENWLDPNKNEVAEIYKPPVGLPSQLYQHAEMGMNLDNSLTEYNGNKHSQGGVSLAGLDVEVEDGESRTGNMIHSDKIIITKDILKRYPFLKPSDVGKTPSAIVKLRMKRYERRKGDFLNDEAYKAAKAPYEIMSDDLSQMYASSEDNRIMAEGGFLDTLWDDGGNAPMIGSAIGMVKSMLTPVEKVDYGQVGFVPTRVTPMSPESGINRIKSTFGNVKGQMRRLNPQGYLNRMNDIGSQEAEAISDYSGKIGIANNENINKASLLDAQQQNRTNMFNSQVAMQEAEANAANRGMKRSITDAYLMNLGTQFGQKARDTKMYGMQDKMIGIQEENLRLMREIYGNVPDDNFTLENTNTPFINTAIGMPNKSAFPEITDLGQNKKRNLLPYSNGGYVPLARRLISKSKF
jgi:hypothetical protein